MKKIGKGIVSEINVTPFVDVVLVLLVIFMVTAPLMYTSVRLKLPKTARVHSLRIQKKHVILSMTKTGEFFIGKKKVLFDEILSNLLHQLKQKKQDVVYLRADYGLNYGKVAKILSYIKKNGISQVSLVTEVEAR